MYFYLQGKITVQFMDITIDLQDFSRKNVYQMVETTAYFEAYSPILEGLQQTEDSDLPFQVGQWNVKSLFFLWKTSLPIVYDSQNWMHKNQFIESD